MLSKPDKMTKFKYEIGQRVLWSNGKQALIIGKGDNNILELICLWKVKKYPYDNIRFISEDQVKPLGYLLIKPTRNGQFRYHSVSWNNEKLQSSEPLESKSHVIKMAKFYFPDFVIIDKTK